MTALFFFALHSNLSSSSFSGLKRRNKPRFWIEKKKQTHILYFETLVYSSMAASIFRSNYENRALGLFVISLMVFIHGGAAFQFTVGGPNGWSVPSNSSAQSYNQWAERNRFKVGDTLLFVYPSDRDSVLSVTREDYTNCQTSSPIKKYSDGHTIFTFNHSGPFYFISGVQDNCQKNEKLVVVVLADRSNRTSDANSPPSPATTPSPAPSPSEGSVEINPSPAPSHESTPPPPRNAAGSVFVGFVSSVGALVGSSALLVL